MSINTPQITQSLPIAPPTEHPVAATALGFAVIGLGVFATYKLAHLLWRGRGDLDATKLPPVTVGSASPREEVERTPLATGDYLSSGEPNETRFPPGLTNYDAHSCYANSMLQMIMSYPLLREQMRGSKEPGAEKLRAIMDQYEVDREMQNSDPEGWSDYERLNTSESLIPILFKDGRPLGGDQDVAEAFSSLLDQYLPFNQHPLCLDLSPDSKKQTDLLDRIENAHQERREDAPHLFKTDALLERASNTLMLRTRRATLGLTNTGKITLPQQVLIPGIYVNSKQDSTYQLRSFAVHLELQGGSPHYVSYVKTKGGEGQTRYFLLNDAERTEVLEKQFLTAAEDFAFALYDNISNKKDV